jgi:hypothetical protein
MRGLAAFVIAAGLLSGSAATLTGCGGGGGGGGNNGSDRAQITTGGNGSLTGVRVGPTPGSVFIASNTTFQIAWPDASAAPPPTVDVSLVRYKEARDGEPRERAPQRIVVSQVSGTPAWNIQRANDFTLDTRGVYYLETQAGGEVRRAAYIVASGRSASTRAAASRVTTGGNGSLSSVQVSPAPGTVALPKGSPLRLTWPNSSPPASFEVNLVRYQEARGGEDHREYTQPVTITQTGTNQWDVKRRDNFDLDEGGVYYLEVTAPGENPVRAAYLISNDF